MPEDEQTKEERLMAVAMGNAVIKPLPDEEDNTTNESPEQLSDEQINKDKEKRERLLNQARESTVVRANPIVVDKETPLLIPPPTQKPQFTEEERACFDYMEECMQKYRIESGIPLADKYWSVRNRFRALRARGRV